MYPAPLNRSSKAGQEVYGECGTGIYHMLYQNELTLFPKTYERDIFISILQGIMIKFILMVDPLIFS